MFKLYADIDFEQKYVTWVCEYFLQEHFDPALPIQRYDDPSFKAVIAEGQDEFKELWLQKQLAAEAEAAPLPSISADQKYVRPNEDLALATAFKTFFFFFMINSLAAK
jgi:hypothetical protein